MALVEIAWASARYPPWLPLPPSCAWLKPRPRISLGKFLMPANPPCYTNSPGFRLLRVLVCSASFLIMASKAPACFLVPNACRLVGAPTLRQCLSLSTPKAPPQSLWLIKVRGAKPGLLGAYQANRGVCGH